MDEQELEKIFKPCATWRGALRNPRLRPRPASRLEPKPPVDAVISYSGATGNWLVGAAPLKPPHSWEPSGPTTTTSVQPVCQIAKQLAELKRFPSI
jgi:hypothetical protein